MFSLPTEFLPFLEAFRQLFSVSVWASVQTLVMGAILCQGNRTVSSALRVVGLGDSPRFRNYHNVLSRARWSSLATAKILFGLLVSLFAPSGFIMLGIDETLERRSGKKIKAKGWYRDAVRSKGNHVAKCLGLEWLCLMLIVPVPWSSRYWALPFWSILQPSKRANEETGKGHKTSIDWTIQALKTIRRWEPARGIILLVDGGFASFDLLEASCRLHITLICRLRIDAKLYDFPPELIQGKRGPKPKKGELMLPLKTLANDDKQPWKKKRLPWYQEGEKAISYLSGVALMHKTKHLPIAVQWVLVRVEGKKNPIAFFSNNVELDPFDILKRYMFRWNVEVTFEEARAHMGIETQRQWSDLAIARTTPCLLGLFSLICCAALSFYRQGELIPRGSAWYKKTEITFSDLMALMRRKTWGDKYFNSEIPPEQKVFSQDDLQVLIYQLIKVA
jgi:hypothetical protein|tara:strand:- start:30 stop:1373 length:1344 start_codon:yes stop_codon:yes gene_type:complete